MSLAFGVTSFVMISLISFIMSSNKIIPTKGTICFKRQLLLFKFYILIDMLCYVYARYLQSKGISIEKGNNNVFLLKLIVLFSFSMLIWLAFTSFKYAIIQANKKIPFYFSICVVFSIIVLFMPIKMSIVNNNLVYDGIAKEFRNIICGIIIIAIGLFLICVKEDVTRKKKECFIIWSIIWILMFIINSIFPQYSLVSITCAFGYLVNFIFIENPENKQGARKETMLFYYIDDCFNYFKSTNPHINIVGFQLETNEDIDNFLEKFDTTNSNFFLFEEDDKNFYVVFSEKNIYLPAFKDYARDNNLQALYFDEFYIKDTSKLSLFFKNNIDSVEKGTIRYITEEDFYKQDKEFEIKREIEQALANKKIVTYIQPIYDVKKKKFTCGECLCRIEKENGELIMPSHFVGVAEKYGLICSIETEMFKNMCQTLQKKDDIGLEHLDANLSIRKGESPILYDEYCSILKNYNVDGKSINLEITETDVIESKNTLIKNMKNLKDIGISFSLDDFGTGESNLGYVIDMPVDIIKFDREIFQKATCNEKAKVVVKHAIKMAHSLGLKVVAEGVETENDVKLCNDMEVDYIQGFYFSKPIPSVEFEEFCKQKNFI